MQAVKTSCGQLSYPLWESGIVFADSHIGIQGDEAADKAALTGEILPF